MTETEERQKVVDISKTWLRTPYHNHAKIKGVGCDCLTIIQGTFEEAGFIADNIEVPKYSPQFMLHSSKETYLEGLMEHGFEVESPQMADIALWKFGRCFSHAALVIEWPIIIHAYYGGSVQEEDVSKAEWLYKNDKVLRPVKFFSYWRPDVSI